MSGHIYIDGDELWRTNLREIKAKKGMRVAEIAVKTALPEKTVARVFSGESKSPGVDIVRRIINALGASWGDVFAESSAVITTQDVECLQEQIKQLSDEIVEMRREHESELLRLKLEYTEKIVAVYDRLVKKEACDDIL